MPSTSTTVKTTKDPKSITAQDVYSHLARDPLDVKGQEEFEMVGIRPTDISGHDIAETYTMLGITPQEFLEVHGGDTFDFHNLKLQFSECCVDYLNAIEHDVPSMAVQFASMIIYKIGPDSRKVKAKQTDKVWIFRFPNLFNITDDKKVSFKSVFVSTFKNEASTYHPCRFDKTKLVVSVKHATLLALETMCKLTDYALGLQTASVLLTPLAGSIFSRTDMGSLAMEAKIPIGDLVKMVNCSCQSGGHYIQYSDIAVAAVAAIMSTQGLRAKNKAIEANSIVTKTIKQYMAAKKDFLEDRFVLFARYATGGLPTGMDAKSLVNLFSACRSAEYKPISAARAVKASDQTLLAAARSDLKLKLGPDAIIEEKASGSNMNIFGVAVPPTAAQVKKDLRRMKSKKDIKVVVEDLGSDEDEQSTDV